MFFSFICCPPFFRWKVKREKSKYEKILRNFKMGDPKGLEALKKKILGAEEDGDYLIDNDMAIGTFGLRNRDPVLEMGILAMQNRDQLTIRDQSLEIDTELIRTLGKKKGDQ